MKLYSKRHNNRLQDSVVLFKSPVTRDPALRQVFYCPVPAVDSVSLEDLKVYIDNVIKQVNEKTKEEPFKPFVSTYIPLTDTDGDEIKTDITFKTRYDENLKTHNTVFEQVMAEMAAEQKLEDSLSAGTFYAPYIPDLPTQKKMEEVSSADVVQKAYTNSFISHRAMLKVSGFSNEDIENMNKEIEETVATYLASLRNGQQ